MLLLFIFCGKFRLEIRFNLIFINYFWIINDHFHIMNFIFVLLF